MYTAVYSVRVDTIERKMVTDWYCSLTKSPQKNKVLNGLGKANSHRGGGGGGGGHVSLGLVRHPHQYKHVILFTTRSVTRNLLRVSKNRKIWREKKGYQIHRSPEQVRWTIHGKGRKFGRATRCGPGTRCHVHPRLGCLSESDWTWMM